MYFGFSQQVLWASLCPRHQDRYVSWKVSTLGGWRGVGLGGGAYRQDLVFNSKSCSCSKPVEVVVQLHSLAFFIPSYGEWIISCNHLMDQVSSSFFFQTLTKLYKQTLEVLGAMPKDATYRTQTEQITQQRLSLVEQVKIIKLTTNNQLTAK